MHCTTKKAFYSCVNCLFKVIMNAHISVITTSLSRTEGEGIPMRIKESLYFLPPHSGEFYNREPKGLDVSGINLQPKGNTGEAISILQATRDSNNHVLFIVDSPVAKVTSSFAAGLPKTYTHLFNESTSSRTPTLEEHYASAISALSETIASRPVVPHVAFAHLLPTSGKNVYTALALSEGMIAMITNISNDQSRDEPHISTIYPDMLTPSHDEPGLSTGMFTIPRGAKLILSTAMDAYQNQDALETVGILYTLSDHILKAAQENTTNAFAQLPLSRVMKEHILNALISVTYTPEYEHYLQERNDMALAALLAGKDIATLIKEEKYGNYILPKRVAFIASRVPPLKRKKAHDS